MSDKPDAYDATTQAVRMERLEGEQRMLSQQIKTSLDTMMQALAAVQSETRNVTSRLSDVVNLQRSHDDNRESIGEVKKSLAELDAKLQSWFDDFETRNERKWELHEANRDEWRRRFELRADEMEATAENETRKVREEVIQFRGLSMGVGLLVSTVVGGFLWSLNERFGTVKEQFAIVNSTIIETKEQTQYNRARIDASTDRLHRIELYLTQKGTDPEALRAIDNPENRND